MGIMGEVDKPGAYDIIQPITALRVLALADGLKSKTPDLTSVVLISKDTNGKSIRTRPDLKRILDVGDMRRLLLVAWPLV